METGTQAGGGSWRAQIRLGRRSGAEVLVVDPFDAADEKQLKWYLEKHLELPLIDHEWATGAETSIHRYGCALFAGIFADPESRALLRRWRQSPGRLEVRGSAAFHRLHWETLWIEGEDAPLSIRVPVVRVLTADDDQPAPPHVHPSDERAADTGMSRILLVTARKGPMDVPVRAVSRPLRDAINGAARVDDVRPGTLRALDEHLRRVPPGRYPVVHLDLHGGVHGPPDQQEAALVFEPDDGDDGWVSAERLGAVLRGCGVSLVVLTACQSGMPAEGGRSFAAQLVAAGIPAVVGMRFAVTVDAAARYTAALYAELTRTSDLNQAQTAARAALFDDPNRLGSFGNRLRLRDWMLPVVHQADHQPVRVTLQETRPPAESDSLGELPGRDYDISIMERRLTRHRVLLIFGLAGVGKSTLLQQVAREWPTTGFADRCLPVSGADLRKADFDISLALRGHVGPASDDPYRTGEPLPGPTSVVVLDHVDDIPDTQLDALVDELLATDPALRIVVAGRGRRPGSRLDGNSYRLPGLSAAVSSHVIGTVIGPRRLHEIANDLHFGRLLRVLHGHPGTLELIAGRLAHRSPAQIVTALQAGSVDPGQAVPADVVFAAVAALPDAIRQRLLTMAPFAGTLPRDLDGYTTAEPDTSTTDVPEWQVCLAALERAGLVEPAGADHPDVTHPLLGCVLRSLVSEAELQRYRVAHGVYVQRLADRIWALLDAHGEGARAAVEPAEAHADDLEVALATALVSGASPTVLFRAADAARTGRPADRLALAETVWAALSARPFTVDHLICLERRSAMLGAVGRHADAERVFEQTLDVVRTLPGLTPEQRHGALADLHHQRGILEHRQRRLDPAARHLRAALAISPKHPSRPDSGKTWHLLGEIELERGRAVEAVGCFTRALTVKERPTERRKTLARLVELLIDSSDSAAAERHFLEYLRLHAGTKLASGNLPADDVELSYLTGRMNILRGDWHAADQKLRFALRTAQATQNAELIPRVLHQLAVTALAGARLDEACSRLEHAARLAQQADRSREAVQILQRLERLYRQNERAQEARGVAARVAVLLSSTT